METLVTEEKTVVVPPELVESLGLMPGSEVEMISEGGSVVIRGKASFAKARKGSLLELAGILKRPGQRALTIEEMDHALEDGIQREWASQNGVDR